MIRKSPPPGVAGSIVKRARASPNPNEQQLVISSGNEREQGLVRSVTRTSGLDAPIVSLTGAHTAEILACRFNPSGQNIAAVSADRTVSLWRTYPPNTNYGHLTGLHKSAIVDVQWSLISPSLYTVGADGNLCISNLTTGQRVKRVKAHRGVINALDRIVTSGTELLATGGDDGYLRIWDVGSDGQAEDVKEPTQEWHIGHPVTALCWSADGAQVIYRQLHGAPAGFENVLSRAAWSKYDGGKRVAVGGADRCVTVWDVESGRILYKLPGHKGTVTCVEFHPKEPIVLTGSKDGILLLGEIDPNL
ncbi:hypothetical protein FRB99_008326 [Tulasnella sp. 403]|nr:hypothetical protein FRB99_008326 [Tulasnella sp. 403]